MTIFSWKKVFAIALCVGVGWFLLMKYTAQLEKVQAMSMQSILVEATIAQEKFVAKNHQYTNSWSDLLPLLRLAPTLEIESEPLPNTSQYFFSFSKKALEKHNGFTVTIGLLPQGQGGWLQAERTGSVLYKYTLTLPDGETTTCTASRGASFCKQMQKSIDELEVKNLVPMQKTESSAK